MNFFGNGKKNKKGKNTKKNVKISMSKGPKQPFWVNVVTTLLVFLLLIAAYSYIVETREEPEEIAISELVLDVKQGEVSSIEVEGNDLTVEYQSGETKVSMKEAGTAISQTFSNYGVTPEMLDAVDIDVKGESGLGYWLINLAPIIIPILFIVFFIWFISRQVRGQGMQALSFGQSKARMTSPDDKAQKITFKDVAGAKEAKEELSEVVDFLKNPRKFLKIGAKIPKGVLLMGAPGTGKCVVGDSIVLTNKGLMEIRDVPTYYAVDNNNKVYGAKLPAVDAENARQKNVSASHWYDLGEQRTYRVQLRNGLDLEGTPEHPVLVMAKNGGLEYREISKLKTGDSVAVSFDNQAFGDSTRVTTRTAYMLGLLSGDGNLSHASRVGFTTTDEELAQTFAEYVREYDESCAVSQASDGITQTVSSWTLKKHLYEAGMSYLLSYEKAIPSSVLQAPKESVAAFVRGLLDTDGSFERYVVSHSTVSKKLSDQLMAVLLNFGVLPARRIRHTKDTTHPRPVYEITISGESLKVFAREIGFGLERKQRQLENYLAAHTVGNTNVDVFPHIADRVVSCWQEMSKRGKSTEKISKLVQKVRSRGRISRSSLKVFTDAFKASGCEHPDAAHLHNIAHSNLFFTPVVNKQQSRNRVYDFTVPNLHSFVSNGIVSHNTLLARAVAGEAGVTFFSISGSEFVEMFVGVGASRVRDLFKMAKQSAPAIIFVDEIDAIGRVRGSGMGGGNDEREQTLNQILVEMDGFEPNEKLVVMAATNRPDVLDPALLRPGRFDRRITIDLPDKADRKAILEVHTDKKPLAEDVDLEVIAQRTPGFSGADLYSLMNEGAILAARENRQKISQYDLIRSIEKVMLGPERRSHVLSQREKKITAYHEAGHALVASVLPHTDPVHKISIISRGRAAGFTLKLPFEDKRLHSKNEFLDDISMSLGGYVAEKLIFDDITTGASNDLQVLTATARNMVTQYGMSDELGPIAFESDSGKPLYGMEGSKDYSQKVNAQIDAEVSRIVNGAYEKAKQILTDHQETLDIIANRLMETETIERDEFEEILVARGIKVKKQEEEGSEAAVSAEGESESGE